MCIELLKTALMILSKTYIIVESIDACAQAERNNILSFFTSIIEKDDTPGRLQGLFVSQDERDIKERLRRAAVVRLNDIDNKPDIRSYAKYWSLKIQEKFNLSANEREYIVSIVCERAEGK
jgi:hypothetical protein